MRVSEHLYVYLWQDHTENNCNTIFIDGKTPLLIDPGHLHRTGNLFDRMRADGVDPERVQVVIATHAHPDHFEGVAAFPESVKIAISRPEETYIEKIGSAAFAQRGLNVPPHRVDFYLKEGELVVGKHEFQVLLTPGHTPGSLSLYWPRHKALISGDVVFVQSVGRSDLPGGDAKLLKKSVERLSKLPVELFLPGHGPALQGATQVLDNFRFITKILLLQ